jgi:hypothetical protein
MQVSGGETGCGIIDRATAKSSSATPPRRYQLKIRKQPARGQQNDDDYYNAINEVVQTRQGAAELSTKNLAKRHQQQRAECRSVSPAESADSGE